MPIYTLSLVQYVGVDKNHFFAGNAEWESPPPLPPERPTGTGQFAFDKKQNLYITGGLLKVRVVVFLIRLRLDSFLLRLYFDFAEPWCF